MKGEELLNAIEHIDADLIEAADGPVKRRYSIVGLVAALAAMLVLTIGIGLYLVFSPAPPVVQGTQPADLPALVASPPRALDIDPLIPWADGTIWTKAFPNSVAIEFPPFFVKIRSCLKLHSVL